MCKTEQPLRSPGDYFMALLNCVHEGVGMSRNRSAVQLYSGWAARNFLATRGAPQGRPAAPQNCIFKAIALSITLACTVPPGKYGRQSHSGIPRDESSTAPHRVRSVGPSRFSMTSYESDSIFLPISAVIWP